MASQSSSSQMALQRPVPDPTTQQLYNEMRREEEQSQRPPSSRSSSSATTASSSSSGSASNSTPSSAGTTPPSRPPAKTTISGAQGRVTKGSRSGRTGPLPEVTKLKAALMRKLGACDECRQRKVKCPHFDLSLFEAAYQATKPPTARPSFPLAAPPPSHVSDSADLLGVGLGVGAAQAAPRSAPESLLLPAATVARHPASGPLRNPQPPVQPHPAPVPVLSAIPPPAPLLSAVPPPALPAWRTVTITVGRETDPLSHEWECLWEHEDSDSEGAAGWPAVASRNPWLPAGVNPWRCTQRFASLEALRLHARWHGLFVHDGVVWRCTGCKAELPTLLDPGVPCPWCGQAELLSWEGRLYGDLVSAGFPARSAIPPDRAWGLTQR